MIALVGAALAGALELETLEHVAQRVPEVHPDRSLGCEGCRERWDAKVKALRKPAKRASDAAALRPLLDELLGTLGASHYAVFPGGPALAELTGEPGALAGGAGLGAGGTTGASLAPSADVAVIWRVEPGSPADLAGLRAGDRVTTIGGLAVAPLLAEVQSSFRGGMAEVVGRALLHSHLDGPLGEPVALALTDARRVDLQRTADGVYGAPGIGVMPGITAVWSDRSEPLPGRDATARVIRFEVFVLPAMERFQAAMQAAREADAAVVLDLRGNPGGVIQVGRGVAGFFAEKPGSLGTMRTVGAALDLAVHPRPPAQRFTGPLAILVDGASGSTSELLAAALQESGRARVFGETTAGMALPSVFERLPNGDVLQLAFGDLTTPGGARIEGVGVTPDVPIARGGPDDRALGAALAWLAEVLP